ncbi:hypothetical protein CONLIGDRAFT_650528 [Coniochaeta ligniaria NRRL 30616]|uniref:Expansin-like EG45 domain-containing protein n=1 Tax=Coniochaeta ligniaria NRRL 30616 TaxID=1408157 RepID=A0A1J7I4X6_9PEZI|nr:hypothetical protein CONLIGDRAFT_650528 [Coniochaeta ligniaria NRRL 30616]
MYSLFFLALGALLVSSTTATQADDPTPTTPSWITPTVSLPSPYDSPSIYITAASAGACQASLAVYSSINCKLQTTLYPSTTTLAFNVDCMGCSKLALSVRAGHCPLGGQHSSYPDTTLTTPRTRWSFVCAPTPAPLVLRRQYD